MTSPENRSMQDLSAGRAEKHLPLFEGFDTPKRKIDSSLGDGEDSKGLFYRDKRGRKWRPVDRIDGYSGQIIFYHDRGRGSVLSRADNFPKRRTRGKGREINYKKP